ncbi:hypothetical protein [Neisseria polysaccharea]|uniref:hypothetical protein n=1 Tax=Neisseria polysaccharea TaxID=489 RepID=UPI00131E976F
MPISRHTAGSGIAGVAAFAGAGIFHTAAELAGGFFEMPMPSEMDKFCSDGI